MTSKKGKRMKLSAKLTNFFRESRMNKLIAGGIALVVVVAGIAFVTIQAAGFFVAAEAEKGRATSNAKVVSDSTASGAAAIQFNAPVVAPPPTGSCAVSTPHVPDGPDGMGGCWPGLSNTGVPKGTTLSAYTGPCTISTANVVIDSKTVNCDIELTASGSGLTIKNSVINGQINPIDENTAASFTVQDSKIDGTVRGTGTGHDGYACTNCGVSGHNFTLKRVEIVHTNRGAYCMEVCNITDTYIHGQNLWPDDPGHPHASALRQEHYTYAEHNTLACDYKGPFNADIGCSADQTGYPDFTYIWHNTFKRNLFVEGNKASGFCAYGGGTMTKPFSNDSRNATYQVYTDNVFQRGANGKCAEYGPVTAFIVGRTGNVWENNKYNDGAIVAPEE